FGVRRSRKRQILSNMDSFAPLRPERTEELVELQKQDEEFGVIYEQVAEMQANPDGERPPALAEYLIYKDVLYRAIGLYGDRNDIDVVVCLPKKLHRTEIAAIHLELIHPGIHGTYSELRKRY